MAACVSFGFNSDELYRVERTQQYDSPIRVSHFPLVLWGWNRQRCHDYIYEKLGVAWRKSACRYCPFARITADHITPKAIPRCHGYGYAYGTAVTGDEPARPTVQRATAISNRP